MVSKPEKYEKKFKSFSKVFYEMYRVSGNSNFTCVDLDEKIPKFDYKVKRVLLMSVKAGKSGQKFSSLVYKKILFIKKNYPKLKIIVDGGVNLSNIEQLSKLNVYGVVVGSSLFNEILENTVEEFSKFI